MKRLLLVLLLVNLSTLQAQEKFTISGVVSDTTTGETLLGATVYISGTSTGTVTNQYGFYSLTTVAGQKDIVFSYLGYKTVIDSVMLTSNVTLNKALGESSDELDEVVITAKDKERLDIKSAQMSSTNLKAKSIKQIPVVLGEVDVVKSIQLLPGVTNGGEGTAGFNVRGGAADQNLVLLDEAIIYNSSHLFGFFSVFNNDVIKDITLYKGGIPSQYGGRVSSVLDVRQKDGNQKNLNLSGGLGAISSRLLIEGPIKKDKGAFLAAGRASYGHLFLNFSEDQKGNSAYFYDVNFKAGYTLGDNNKVYFSGYLGQDVFKFENAFNNTYGNTSLNLRWNHVFSNKLFSNLSLIYSKYDYSLGLGFIDLDWESDIKNYNLKYDFKHYLSDKITFNYGVSSIYYKFNPGEVMPSTEESSINYRKLQNKHALESAFYGAINHKISPKLTANYGFRYSYFLRLGEDNLALYNNDLPVTYNEVLKIYESASNIGSTAYSKNKTIKNYGNFEPRLALSYQLNNTASVKLSYNRMAQYLHLISNTASVTPLDVWAPSGKYIKPQLADQYAIGYFKNLNDNKFSFSAESYYKEVKNRLDYIDGSDLIAQDYIETQVLSGEMRSYGLELLFRKNKGSFTGWIAYTLSKSEQKTTGAGVGGLGINDGNWYNTSFDRPHDVSVTGSYKLNDKWQFGANAIYQTGRPVTYPNGQYEYQGLSVASYDDRNANRLPSYHRVDVSATLTPRKNKTRKWKSEWVFGVYNLYNRKNAASISFRQDEKSGFNEAVRTSIFGVVPAITYNFKF
jgi:hypothetical protein